MCLTSFSFLKEALFPSSSQFSIYSLLASLLKIIFSGNIGGTEANFHFLCPQYFYLQAAFTFEQCYH